MSDLPKAIAIATRQASADAVRRSHQHLFQSHDVDSYLIKPSTDVNTKRRALLVDDVVITQRITSAMLQRSGFHCDLASDGLEAVDLAAKSTYLVILMDVQLPVLNGVDATKKIREFESSHGSNRAVIYGLTANCTDEALGNYNEAGMDGCIEKGCIVSRAMHEALAVTRENPQYFVFINSRNVQKIQRRHHISPAESSTLVMPDQSNVPPMELDGVQSSNSFIGRPDANSTVQTSALLVDDLKITNKITQAALAKTGFHCDLAGLGFEAVEKAKEREYNVILMDVQLPDLGGCEATSMIRSFEASLNRQPTIIFGLTGSCSEQDLNNYARAGMNGCIEKGCVVSRAIHEALAMHQENPNVFLFIDAQNIHVRGQQVQSTDL